MRVLLYSGDRRTRPPLPLTLPSVRDVGSACALLRDAGYEQLVMTPLPHDLIHIALYEGRPGPHDPERFGVGASGDAIVMSVVPGRDAPLDFDLRPHLYRPFSVYDSTDFTKPRHHRNVVHHTKAKERRRRYYYICPTAGGQ